MKTIMYFICWPFVVIFVICIFIVFVCKKGITETMVDYTMRGIEEDDINFFIKYFDIAEPYIWGISTISYILIIKWIFF